MPKPRKPKPKTGAAALAELKREDFSPLSAKQLGASLCKAVKPKRK